MSIKTEQRKVTKSTHASTTYGTQYIVDGRFGSYEIYGKGEIVTIRMFPDGSSHVQALSQIEPTKMTPEQTDTFLRFFTEPVDSDEPKESAPDHEIDYLPDALEELARICEGITNDTQRERAKDLNNFIWNECDRMGVL